jgi:2-polyprenyl-3-methyl-5-hydroxy-6-metoxy-1,4-benzoquinol methylase
MGNSIHEETMRGLVRVITAQEESIVSTEPQPVTAGKSRGPEAGPPSLDPDRVEAIADSAIGYLSGASISGLAYLGDRLGIYRAMEGAGLLTSAELAERSGLHERWVREWLHAQAAAGLVDYSGDGRYQLTAEQAAVLADEDHPAFAGGGFHLVLPLLQQIEGIAESFRTGQGVPYNALGAEHARGEARFSGPWMRANLVPVILPGLDGVVERLTAGGKVADVGCGSGGATLEMAKAFPRSQFHGYDSAELAIGFARERLAVAGLDNVTFHHAPAQSLAQDACFDFVLCWDCLHDMTDPAGAVRAIRGAIAPDGRWLIVDINGAASPEENYRHPLGGLLYAVSVLDCLRCSTCEDGGAALGTLGMPEPVARKLIAEAGFTRFTAHDFGNPVNAFYEVAP